MEQKTQHEYDLVLSENNSETKTPYVKPIIEDLGRIVDRFELSPDGTDYDVFT